MTIAPASGLADRYEREVLPRLIEQPDDAFPDFGFVRDPNGWRATKRNPRPARLPRRPRRLPRRHTRGILIHGHGPVLFTTLVNHMQPAGGRDFVRAVRGLAARVVADLDLNTPPSPDTACAGAREQVVLDLEVEPARRPRHDAPVR